MRYESTVIDLTSEIEGIILHSNLFNFICTVMLAEVHLEDIFFNFPQNDSF